MHPGFRIRTPSVPLASIIWLAHAVNVVRPAARRLHIDRARFAKGWHLGNTLGACMSGSRPGGCSTTSTLRKDLKSWRLDYDFIPLALRPVSPTVISITWKAK
jgi:hypothetical protein